ncbi:MAG: BCCT family transporter [Firmicutes bacterium]|nr:BCCT family transporter [Bacillota bacterium]
MRVDNSHKKELFSRNFTKFGLDMNPVVSILSGLIVIAFSGFALTNLEYANTVFSKLKATIITNFDWLFILSSCLFIIMCLFLAFSKFGKIRLGGKDIKPEFSNFAWYSMLISAGMGIGLMFWSVGEPLYHNKYLPPIFQSGDTVTSALSTTFFHWGFHPWGIYALMSLSLAYFAFNKNLPLSMRSVFYPIFKERIFGIVGDLIDVLAVVACLFGLATSLGLGVQQINSGLEYLFNVPYNVNIQVILIISITLIATLSVVSGIDKGVKFLSELNIKIAGAFMLAVLLFGPTMFILRTFSNSLGLYLNDFINSSFFINTGEGTWQGDWSIFYLAWWISWSPFVGMFVARISKGRTIKEFVLAVMIIPSFLSFIWLSVFGGTSIYLDQITNGAIFQAVQSNLPVAMFEMIKYMDIAQVIKTILSVLGTFLVISFFVTSSDSGSLVVDNITSGGKIDSPVPQRVFWASMEGLVAAILLLIGGEKALIALQTAVITTGLPFAILMTVMGFALIHTVRKDFKVMDIPGYNEKVVELKDIKSKKTITSNKLVDVE